MSAPVALAVRAGDRTIPVELYLAEPGAPAVVVLHEIFGVNDDMRRICRRFVENGYHAALPDLYRGGHWLRCMWRTLLHLAREGRSVTDIEAVIDALEARDDTGKVGVVGFCMGGGFAGLLGTRRELGATAIFYGEAPSREKMTRRMCPTFAGYGGKDRSYARFAEQLERDLIELGVPHEVKRYDEAGHSYMNNAGHPVLATLTRPLMHVEYNEQAAEDSWQRMLAFFAEHLGQDRAEGAATLSSRS